MHCVSGMLSEWFNTYEIDMKNMVYYGRVIPVFHPENAKIFVARDVLYRKSITIPDK